MNPVDNITATAAVIARRSHEGMKLKSYSIEFKAEAVEWHQQNRENVSLTANKFGVDRKKVRDWNTKYGQLAGQCHGKQKKKQKIHSGKLKMCTQDKDYKIFLHRWLYCKQ